MHPHDVGVTAPSEALLSAAPASASPRSLRKARPNRRVGVAAGVAATTIFLLAGGGIAAAAPTGGFAGRGGPGITGTLQAVKGATLTVKTSSGAIEKATVTRSTTYQKTQSGGISLLTNGTKVTAIGSLSSGKLNATRVMIGGVTGLFGGGGAGGPGRPSGAPGGGAAGRSGRGEGGTAPAGAGGAPGAAGGGTAGFTFVSGTVSDLTAKSFTLTETSGTKGTVNVASTTTFTKTTKIAESGLTVGQTVTVRGTKGKTSASVTATDVVEGKAGAFGGFGGFAHGTRPPAA